MPAAYFAPEPIKAYPEAEVILSGMVRSSVAPENVLECRIGDGLEPLCKFLDKPIPSDAFPLINQAAAFKQRMRNANVANTKTRSERALGISAHVCAGRAGGLIKASNRRHKDGPRSNLEPQRSGVGRVRPGGGDVIGPRPAPAGDARLRHGCVSDTAAFRTRLRFGSARKLDVDWRPEDGLAVFRAAPTGLLIRTRTLRNGPGAASRVLVSPAVADAVAAGAHVGGKGRPPSAAERPRQTSFACLSSVLSPAAVARVGSPSRQQHCLHPASPRWNETRCGETPRSARASGQVSTPSRDLDGPRSHISSRRPRCPARRYPTATKGPINLLDSREEAAEDKVRRPAELSVPRRHHGETEDGAVGQTGPRAALGRGNVRGDIDAVGPRGDIVAAARLRIGLQHPDSRMPPPGPIQQVLLSRLPTELGQHPVQHPDVKGTLVAALCGSGDDGTTTQTTLRGFMTIPLDPTTTSNTTPSKTNSDSASRPAETSQSTTSTKSADSRASQEVTRPPPTSSRTSSTTPAQAGQTLPPGSGGGSPFDFVAAAAGTSVRPMDTFAIPGVVACAVGLLLAR
ncbi:Uncharacterized protein TCAP_02681 [Tolypocladium capitatum]|uniref:Uncharacterized protein n=1 Tax=Tolypocladium capitatum TaxID=45235 RepID=A0A2K3QIM8_9HYPO|nr:Uncharacterized protein TCAP_02681 [Tolypocladium capitatum]